jgi:hypothetical protein
MLSRDSAIGNDSAHGGSTDILKSSRLRAQDIGRPAIFCHPEFAASCE